MGVVYAAEDDRLGRAVALKFVPEEMAKDQQAIERLRAEARTASGLNHPNICTIYDIGEYEGRPFIVMELLRGQTLRERLTSGPVKVHDAVELGIHVADALDAAHHRGVMHRDIKPANLFLVERGQVKILDFGLAKLVRQQLASTTTGPTRDQTAEGVTLGTVSYMSPEQVTGEALDGRTDLFSLGVVLYECLTGHQPFTGKTSAVIFSAILTRAPLAPIVFNPDIPLRLQDVINNCLEKDRELRYQDAAGLRADLKRVKRDLESGHSGVFTLGGATTSGVAGGVRPSHAGHSDSLMRHDSPSSHDIAARHDSASREPLNRTGERRGGSFATTTIVLALVVALGAAGSFILWSRSRTTTTTGSPPAQPSSSGRTRLALASTSLDAKDYRNALAHADEVLRNAPDDPDAIRIRDAARAMIDRFDRAVGRARERLAAGDPDAAASAINEARAIEPSSPIVVELSGELVKQLRTQAETARRDAERLRTVPAPPTRQATDSSRTDPQRQRTPRESPAKPAPPAPAPTASSPPATTTSSEPQPSQSPTGSAPSPAAQPPVTTTPPAAQPPPVTAPVVPGPVPSEPATPPPSPAPTEASPEQREPARAGPTVESDDAAIRRVVMSYGRAIESKDIALFRRVKPNLSPDEQRRIEDSFRSVASQQVAITILSIELHGDDASVRLRRRDTIQAGGRQQTTETQQTMTLTRSASGWVIRDIGR
jgi:serine/threonine protein kinase